jgi:hypothetical protein
MRIVLLSVIIIIFVSCCNATTDPNNLEPVDRIRIKSKGVNTPKDEYEISDSTYVNGIIREFKKIDPYVPDSGRSSIPVKSNRGYFEVRIYENTVEKAVFEVVYTTYYGVIISLENKYYRNDRLEYMIIAAISSQ